MYPHLKLNWTNRVNFILNFEDVIKRTQTSSLYEHIKKIFHVEK